jgi:hypothetical protein
MLQKNAYEPSCDSWRMRAPFAPLAVCGTDLLPVAGARRALPRTTDFRRVSRRSFNFAPQWIFFQDPRQFLRICARAIISMFVGGAII